jgi:hypothetical protein
MLDKRVYHIALTSKGTYQVTSKGLLKSIRILKNGFDPLPQNPILYINGKEVVMKYSNDPLYYDFEFITNEINNMCDSQDDLDIDFDPHVIRMCLLSGNTRAIPHYSHLPLKDVNSAVFTHEIDIEFKPEDLVFLKELKIEEEFYLPTFKLNKSVED